MTKGHVAAVIAAVVAAVGSCGNAQQPRPDVAIAAKASTPAHARGGLAPGSCAEARWGPTQSEPIVTAVPGLNVGITMKRDLDTYRVDDVRVEVLAPDAVLEQEPGGPDPILARSNRPLVAIEQRDLEEADRTVAVTFTGSDDEGNALPPGRYPVIYALGTSGVGECDGPPWVTYGLLTTLDWQG